MFEVFIKTLPFFALILTGFVAGRRAFPPEATLWLTRWVFYVPLSAMLFRFAATLDLQDVIDLRFIAAYLLGTLAVWTLAIIVANARGLPLAERAMEAQCAITGNTGFLGVPLLIALLGQAATGPVLMILAVDMIVFSTLITLLMTAARGQRLRPGLMIGGLLRNPMIASMAAGLVVAGMAIPLPQTVQSYLTILGQAATPGALFAIGASLAQRRVGRIGPALWLSVAKLILHPLAVLIMAAMLGVAPFPMLVMGMAAALPVAGNVYMLASYFNTSQGPVSTAILVTTALSILTIPLILHLIIGGN